MKRDRQLACAGGRLVVRGKSDLDATAAELVSRAARTDSPVGEWVRRGEGRLRAKGSALAPATAWRHGLGRLLGSSVPSMREYQNLRWLERRVFQVSRPRAAAVLWRRGVPRYQLLLTREVLAARPLAAALPEEPPDHRRALAAELGRELARMHALGFAHGGLGEGGVLVLPHGTPRRVVFCDVSHGGRLGTRRAAHADLVGLFRGGAGSWDPDERALLIEAYLAGRSVQECPASSALRRHIEGLLGGQIASRA